MVSLCLYLFIVIEEKFQMAWEEFPKLTDILNSPIGWLGVDKLV